MFGYIVPNKPELKICQFDEYREYYCGLCNCLRKKHGIQGQISLSYDYTFLYMLFSALYEPCEERKKHVCLLHMSKGVKIRENTMAEYVSDMGIILTWLKCSDDWKDDRNIIKKGYSLTLSSDYKRLKAKYGDKVEVIEQSLMNIHKGEQENNLDVDTMSGYFGTAFAEIMTPYEDEWEEQLRKIGYYLGKFIYILDAFDDIEKDIKAKNYNPFLNNYMDEGFNERIKEMLMVNAAKCASEFEKLPIVDKVEILRNILYSGIWTGYNTAVNRRMNNEKSI